MIYCKIQHETKKTLHRVYYTCNEPFVAVPPRSFYGMGREPQSTWKNREVSEENVTFLTMAQRLSLGCQVNDVQEKLTLIEGMPETEYCKMVYTSKKGEIVN